jgi:hypothetical protein
LKQHLHIICSGSPWPPDCSVSKDIFYTIESFYNDGKKIHLHYSCENEDRHPNELNKYCESICIHKSKIDTSVFQKDEFPVLMEGIKCLERISFIFENDRKIVVRIHDGNEESTESTGILKGFLFGKKSGKAGKELPDKYFYACMNPHDVDAYKKVFNLSNVVYVPAFVAEKNVCCCEGLGSFCLFYGDLSILANEKAATWLLTKVFNDLKMPFVIAGKKPSERVSRLSHFYQHACLVIDPTPGVLNDLIRKAQIIMITSFESSSSYNVVESLFAGRHCVINDSGIKNDELCDLCHIAKDSGQFKSLIRELFQRPLHKEEIEKRKEVLLPMFSNERSVKQLSEYLW